MNLLKDRLLESDKFYQSAKVSGKWMAVGAATLIGGAAANIAGIKEGYEIAAAAGIPIFTIGSYGMAGCVVLDMFRAAEGDENNDDRGDDTNAQ